MKKGFTLLETIIAIAILVGSSLAVYGATARILANVNEQKTKFIAAYLAQEGIEVVRNMRDTNWISSAPDWNTGLDAGDYRVQYDSTSLLANGDVALKLDSNHFYNYDTGTATQFKRKITLSQPTDYIVKIIAEVSWPGQTSPITVEEFLYNWR